MHNNQDNESDFSSTGLPKPSEFMKNRRPELFSDSTQNTRPYISKQALSYHLETLTSRSEEFVFEELCRALARKELCPNIKPATGPVAGGDGKTDGVTYPVSKDLTLRCFFGTPVKATDEKWAFAFSCQSNWKRKVKKDVEKIAGLITKFAKVYFISNQYIKKRDQDKLQIELTQQYGFEVEILDKNWILEIVYKRNRIELAIEKLGLQEYDEKPTPLGPQDTIRSDELNKILEKLSNPDTYWSNDFAIARDYLRAAKLSRGLEKPRSEVEGLFVRSQEIALEWGNVKQIIDCYYHHAWTCYWWYDDPTKCSNIYSVLESYLDHHCDAEECELLFNLLLIINTSVYNNTIDKSEASINNRIQSLKKALIRNTKTKSQPNNSLYAEFVLLFISLKEAMFNGKETSSIFLEMEKRFKKSKGYSTVPIVKFIDRLVELSEFIEPTPAFDSLFKTMSIIVKDRNGDVAEGELYYRRGVQYLNNNNFKMALKFLGVARIRMLKEESLGSSLRASLACFDSYIRMGSYWAARMEALSVAHATLKSTELMYEYPIEAFDACRCMAWAELGLGRVPQFLVWHEMFCRTIGLMKQTNSDLQDLEKEVEKQDVIFGSWILNLDKSIIKEIDGIQKVLEQVGLFASKWALLYRLGEKNVIMKEMPKELTETSAKFEKYFDDWKQYRPFTHEMTNQRSYTGEYFSYSFEMMGVTYKAKVRNKFGAILFAENLLGILQAALAIADWKNLAFIVEDVKLVIDINSNGTNPPEINLDKPTLRAEYEFYWREDMLDWMQSGKRDEICDFFMKFLLKMLMEITIDPLKELTRELDQWHKDETFNRAIGNSPTSIAISDLIGEQLYGLEYWQRATIT